MLNDSFSFKSNDKVPIVPAYSSTILDVMERQREKDQQDSYRREQERQRELKMAHHAQICSGFSR